MILYSIQSAKLYEKLLMEKMLINSGDFLDDTTNDFARSYNWMAEQMEFHGLSKPAGAVYPFWGWYKYNLQKAKPDLRHAGHAPRGTRCVCLELELPDVAVLLSNFDTWHCILNDYPVLTDEDWERQYNEFKSLQSEEQRKKKIKSWQQIFSDFGKSPVQAVFWKLEIDAVRTVRFFTAQ